MPESFKELSFIGKVISVLGKGVVGRLGSEGSDLVEGLSSSQTVLDG